ncbi:GNAT family N-acetyltransferase [Oceanivirga salmonicida]|uniref:GNAT family N-acetyltransferase n=1 Tax=Oceanivirga salmonicida TaxID=1769291 RepID=UPI00082B2B95|nr:GNAT family N-acetyltransferase [Oceanivirga salmonicida]
MDYTIREMKKDEYDLLSNFLYEAIYIPEGIKLPPKSIIKIPELQVYIHDFGISEHDKALVAIINENVIACCWVRIMNDYGHIDNNTPSLSISIYKEYRNLGIGAKLLEKMILMLKSFNYNGISLSVQKENYAVKMYKKVGFNVVRENKDEYIMLYKYKKGV